MNDQFFTAEQWSELSQAIDLFDRNGNRAPLNRVLIAVLKSFVESLDDDSPMDNEEDMEQQFVIASIESELADILADHNSIPGWCRSRRVQPFRKNAHKYSDYIINLVRGKALDTSQRGYLSNELVQRLFVDQMSPESLSELIQRAKKDRDGRINYRDLAFFVLITE